MSVSIVVGEAVESAPVEVGIQVHFTFDGEGLYVGQLIVVGRAVIISRISTTEEDVVMEVSKDDAVVGDEVVDVGVCVDIACVLEGVKVGLDNIFVGCSEDGGRVGLLKGRYDIAFSVGCNVAFFPRPRRPIGNFAMVGGRESSSPLPAVTADEDASETMLLSLCTCKMFLLLTMFLL